MKVLLVEDEPGLVSVIVRGLTDAGMEVSVAADGKLLRLFVGDIRLVYNAQKQLILFAGVVNIQDEKAKSQQAVITYYY